MNRVTPVYFFTLLPEVLVMAGLIVALVFAVARRNRLGTKAFGLVATGLGLMIISECAGGFFNFLLYYTLADVAPGARVGPFATMVTLLGRGMQLVGLGLVIAAVFADRPRRTVP